MKAYEIRKRVEAKSIKDALKKEKDVSAEYVIMIDEGGEEIEEGSLNIGFHGKGRQ